MAIARARRWLVRRLTPVIHARVAAALDKGPVTATRQMVEDLVQDVWAGLCARHYADLKRWDPERGASLVTFVSVCAERRTVDFLRSGRRNANVEHPWPHDELEREVGVVASLEAQVEAKHLAARLVAGLRAELSPRGNAALEAMYMEGMGVDEAARALRTTPAALYSWRRDIRRLAQQLLRDWFASEV